jgi:hypothetical protein
MRNVTLDAHAFPSIFPTGMYKFEYQCSLARDDSPVVNVTLIVYINSNLKESFGK